MTAVAILLARETFYDKIIEYKLSTLLDIAFDFSRDASSSKTTDICEYPTSDSIFIRRVIFVFSLTMLNFQKFHFIGLGFLNHCHGSESNRILFKVFEIPRRSHGKTSSIFTPPKKVLETAINILAYLVWWNWRNDLGYTPTPAPIEMLSERRERSLLLGFQSGLLFVAAVRRFSLSYGFIVIHTEQYFYACPHTHTHLYIY